MQKIIRNVRDINTADREALEHVVGRPLREDQQVVIDVVTVNAPAPEAVAPAEPGRLPEWCNVYEGMTNEEIDAIEKSIIRSRGSRSFD